MDASFALSLERRSGARRYRNGLARLPLWAAFAFAATLLVSVSGIARADDTCGDVNGDGNITPVDALTILNAAVGVEVPLTCSSGGSLDGGNATAPEDGCGDVNGDGNLTPVDALMVLNRSVGFEIEFTCADDSTARNRVRYLNALVCNDQDFTSKLTLTAEDISWSSRSGVPSPYKDYDNAQLGGGWTCTLGPCGSQNFSDLVNLEAGRPVRIELTLSDFGTLDLKFYYEGSTALTAGEPLAVISVPAPAGLSVAE